MALDKELERIKSEVADISCKMLTGKTVEELPMDVPFELILTNFESLQLYGFGTSLLFYGQALGHKVVSKEEYLLSSARYRAHVKGLQTLDNASKMEL